ncbi:MAG: transposase [Rhodocyclaceae bacterium]|nr:transposase [Rhodocyclaceae bacterium]MCA3593501.1 transposase [Methylocystis sp.]MCA3653783.1 transposase [Methylobacterium sp.]
MLRRLGHQPRIIPAIYVKPFSKGQKNDYNDAEAIVEAVLRPNLRAVPKKRGISSTCRGFTVCVTASSQGVPPRSIKFAPSS